MSESYDCAVDPDYLAHRDRRAARLAAAARVPYPLSGPLSGPASSAAAWAARQAPGKHAEGKTMEGVQEHTVERRAREFTDEVERLRREVFAPVAAKAVAEGCAPLVVVAGQLEAALNQCLALKENEYDTAVKLFREMAELVIGIDDHRRELMSRVEGLEDRLS